MLAQIKPETPYESTATLVLEQGYTINEARLTVGVEAVLRHYV